MEMQGKAKFVWVDDYYHSHWLLTEFEGNEDYDIAPGFEMPASFVAEWAASHKKVEALEDLLVEKQRMLDEKLDREIEAARLTEGWKRFHETVDPEYLAQLIEDMKYDARNVQ